MKFIILALSFSISAFALSELVTFEPFVSCGDGYFVLHSVKNKSDGQTKYGIAVKGHDVTIPVSVGALGAYRFYEFQYLGFKPSIIETAIFDGNKIESSYSISFPNMKCEKL